MRGTRRIRLLIGATALAMGVALTGTPAMADTISENPTGTGGTSWVGSDTIDVSQLTIVGVIDVATGEVTDVTPYHPEPTNESGVADPAAGRGGSATNITHPSCGGRIDFYRLVSASGVQQCFANAGTWELSSGYWTQIQYLCPGNNLGRTKYYAGSANYWSVWRGPESNYNTCYSFNGTVPAFAVQIA